MSASVRAEAVVAGRLQHPSEARMQMLEELVESQDAAALLCHVNILYWKPRWLLVFKGRCIHTGGAVDVCAPAVIDLFPRRGILG